MKSALVAAALIAVSFGSATASESYRSTDGTPRGNWTGPYIGGHAGYGWARSSNSWRSPGAGYFAWQPDGDIDDGGFVSGGHVGYQYQFGRFVLGAEADFSFSQLKGDDSQFAGLVNSLEVRHFGTFRARLGWTYGRSMLFATGGYAYGGITKGDETLGASVKHDVDGWTIGGGLEHQFAAGWRGRLEYQYIDFGKTESYLDFGGGMYYEHRVDDLSIHVMRIGLSYGF